MTAALGFATILTFLALTTFVRRVSVPVAPPARSPSDHIRGGTA